MAAGVEGVNTPRRYYLLKSFAAFDDGIEGLQRTWWSKQDDASGTALDATVPFQTELAAARYTTFEDLDGATLDELRKRAGLNSSQAQAVIDALP